MKKILFFLFLSTISTFVFSQDDVYNPPQSPDPATFRVRVQSSNEQYAGSLQEYNPDGIYEEGMYSRRLRRMYLPMDMRMSIWNSPWGYGSGFQMGFGYWNSWNDPFAWNNPWGWNNMFDPWGWNSWNNPWAYNSWNNWNNPWGWNSVWTFPWGWNRNRVVIIDRGRNNGWVSNSGNTNVSNRQTTNNTPRGFGRYDQTYRSSPSLPQTGGTFSSPSSGSRNTGRYSSGGSVESSNNSRTNNSSGSFGFGNGSSRSADNSSGGARSGNNNGRTGRF